MASWTSTPLENPKSYVKRLKKAKAHKGEEQKEAVAH